MQDFITIFLGIMCCILFVILIFKKWKIYEVNKDIVFCITGKVHTVKNRDELKALIEAQGGKVVGSMSGNVNYLVNNDITSTSSKNIAAKKMNIPIITEEELRLMF